MIYFKSVLQHKKYCIWKINNNILLLLGPYGCIDAEHTLGLLRKILEGVEYIHSRGIMHRDLKVRRIVTFHLIGRRSHAFAVIRG